MEEGFIIRLFNFKSGSDFRYALTKNTLKERKILTYWNLYKDEG